MTHFLQATASTLIHFCWQAAAIALIYRVAARVMERSSSHARYAVALAALLAMLASAVVTFAWQIIPDAAPRVMAMPVITAEFPRIAEPGMAHSAGQSSAGDSIAAAIPSWMLLINALWLMGVCGLSLRNLGGWWFIQRLRAKAAKFPASRELQLRFLEISAALGVRKPVLLRISDAIASPVTLGALRSIVLLPVSAVSGLGPDELNVVLAHELAHVRRADFLWNLLQALVETLFFFHPAVWWISGRIRYERELCCDDLALQVCPNPLVYANALFHLEQQRSGQAHLAMALDGHQTRQTLRMRIARILGEPESAAGRGRRPSSIASVFAAAVVLLFSAPHVIASLRPVHAASSPQAVAHLVAASATRPAVAAVASATKVLAPARAIQAAAPSPQPKAKAMADDAARASAAQATSAPKQSYIDQMKAAGYDVDLDKLIAMKIQNVTPEFARSMSQVGFGKPSADELVSCKIFGVTPEVIAQLKQQGLQVSSLQDAVSYQIFKVTPEFVAGMKNAGFSNLDSKQLLSLRVQGVTPEYARSIATQFPGATADDVLQCRIFKIDADFIAEAKKHGFNNLSLKKLVQLRISGLMDDETK